MAAEVVLLMTVLNYVLGGLPPALSQGLYFLLSLGLYPSLSGSVPLSLGLSPSLDLSPSISTSVYPHPHQGPCPPLPASLSPSLWICPILWR